MNKHPLIYWIAHINKETGVVEKTSYPWKSQQFFTASMIKIVFADLLYHLHKNIGEHITIQEHHKVSAWWVLHLMKYPQTISIELAMYLMITISDNTATNIVLEILKQYWDITLLIQKIYNKNVQVLDDHINYTFEDFKGWGSATISEFLDILVHILYKWPYWENIKTLMRAQYIQWRWLRYIADSTITDSGNKTWHLDTLINDCWFVEKGNDAFVYVASIETPWHYDFEYWTENPYTKLLWATIAEEIRKMDKNI
jgi:hypothetical protein